MPAMIRCLIISPTKNGRLIIESHLRLIKHLTYEKSCSSLSAAGDQLSKKSIDILIIEIPSPLSKQEKALYWKIKPRPSVIIISNNINIAAEAFEMNASDFLLQPITHQRILEAIAKVLIIQDYKTMEQFKNGSSALFLPGTEMKNNNREYKLAGKIRKKQKMT